MTAIAPRALPPRRRRRAFAAAPTTLLAACFAACFALLCARASAEFNETLTLRPLQDGSKVLAHFRFSTREAANVTDGAFPKVLRQILTKYDAESLHLTFALGRHSDARYGVAYGVGSDALAHAPFGARLQVRLRESAGGDDGEDDEPSVAGTDLSAATLERWRGLTAELGGIFSASLNQMGPTVVTDMSDVDPRELGAFPRDDDADGARRGRFLHASLAREEVCTENLTPWLKMLPCRSHAGLGQLVDPIKVVSGEFLSLSLFAARSARDGAWELTQQLASVQPLRAAERRRWSLGALFFHSAPPAGAALAACPLARDSAVFTDTPAAGFAPLLAPDASAAAGARVVHTTRLLARRVPLSAPWLERAGDAPAAAAHRDVASAHRFATGYGQVHGGVAVRLENRHARCAMRVTFVDVLPWYLRVYFSSFRASAPELLERAAFVPAELRGRPSELRLALRLPPNASFVFSVQFDKAFLRLSEHPPDANRGFDVPAGVATFEPLADDAACAELRADPRAFTRTLFTEPLLVPLPTPDFSMPYNVITMTSTVVAFFVGSMLNTLLRKAPRIKQMMAQQ